MPMKHFKLSMALFLAIWAIPGLIFAVENNFRVGESSGKLLEFPVGVRPTGMGTAFVGLADDISAVNWNPAGLAQVIGREIYIGHSSLYSLYSVESLAYSQPVGGGVGEVAVNYANYGNVEQFELDANENPVPLNSSVSPHAVFGTLAWSKSITKYFALGLAVKGMQENYGVDSRVMAALDLGAYYLTGIQGLNLGLCAQNLQLPGVRQTLPVLTRFGLAYDLPFTVFAEDRLTGAVDLNLPAVSAASAAVGLEYWLRDLVALRAGYRIGEQNQIDRLLGFSAGASVKLYFVELDYAFVPNSEIGDSHRISLTARFATDLERAELDQKAKQPEAKSKAAPKRYFYQYLFSTE